LRYAKFFICYGMIGIVLLAFSAEAVEPSPGRIVSLGPTVTEKLFLLGAGDRLVGVTTYCQRPSAAQDREKVGSVTQANVEKILQLAPDLVMATSLTDPRAVARLRSLGLRTIVFNEPNSFGEMNEQFLLLGKLVGKEGEAQRIVKEAEKKVEFIRRKKHGPKRPKVFVQVGTKPLFTVTRRSFINDFIEYAGGVNIAAEALNGSYSREQVVRGNPDVIMVVAMGLAAQDEMKAWQKFSTLNAVKTGRLHIMDPYKVCSPTPLTFAETLGDIEALFYPKGNHGEGKH
jgi:iron complex transport system substrate-binding protein